MSDDEPEAPKDDDRPPSPDDLPPADNLPSILLLLGIGFAIFYFAANICSLR